MKPFLDLIVCRCFTHRVIASTQMVFTGLVACCFLSEPCGLFETAIVILTLSGVIIVIQPEFIFGGVQAASSIQDGSWHYVAAAVIMFGSICSSFAIVAIR